VQCYELSLPAGGPGLALHGGAGDRVAELSLEGQAEYGRGLGAAYAAGWNVLSNGGTALDAVCAAVEVLENDPLFNAGRGAALTADGRAELDASVMTGDGQAGAVAASKHAKNPVRLARRVMEDTPHVLLVDPSEKLVREFGLDTAGQDYFVTPARVSCTGHGEAFIRGVVAYDIAARVRYTRARLLDAVRATVEGELSSCGATGGLIAVGGDGAVVVAHNSPAMFSAHGSGAQPEIHT
jgi:beta-aspartyl-peptidase (threonine type)